jgi:hypothetical protein
MDILNWQFLSETARISHLTSGHRQSALVTITMEVSIFAKSLRA